MTLEYHAKKFPRLDNYPEDVSRMKLIEYVKKLVDWAEEAEGEVGKLQRDGEFAVKTLNKQIEEREGRLGTIRKIVFDTEWKTLEQVTNNLWRLREALK